MFRLPSPPRPKWFRACLGKTASTEATGLSVRWPCATAHAMTAAMRRLIRGAASVLTFHIGFRMANTLAAVIASTRLPPIVGMA